MKLFKWEDFKFKFLNVTLLKIGQKKHRMFFFLFGIPIFEFKAPILDFYKQIKENSDFDMRHYDQKLSDYVKVTNNIYNDFSVNKIAYLATELYDIGGHTKCVETLAESLKVDYEQCLFLTKKVSSYENAPITMNKLENVIKIDGIDKNLLFFEKQVDELFNQIISFGAKIIFVYIHPGDILAAAVLSLIKKMTNIRIIFCNHASHYPNIGMTFSDLILEGGTLSTKITNEKRRLSNTKIIGIQSKKEGETRYYSEAELFKIRQNIGIKSAELMTISGGASYKFFENDTSEYFEMIKQLLISKENLKHVIMTNLKKKQKKVIDKIFDSSELEKRLIILPLSSDYEKYFQAADLYIDSFPVSSALTQVDMMRLKVASVVKVNAKNPEWSFHEYMPSNYPYMFEHTDELLSSIINLLDNKVKREEIIKSNYEFWLQHWESTAFKKSIEKIIKEVING